MKTPSTWQNYSRFTEARGLLVLQILQKYTKVQNKNVLDVGCGKGGTAHILAQHGVNVSAIDVKDNFNYKNDSICFKMMSADNLQFDDEEFDIIVLQDVLEHLYDRNCTLSEIKRVLKKNGIFFLSTPNRLSPLNFISDPHWNLPFLSILPREWVVFFVKSVFQKDKRNRDDWAALLSLFKLKRLLENNHFKFEFTNAEVANLMFRSPSSVVCYSLHLKIISYLKRMKGEEWICRIVNNKLGLFNYLINPTWYIVGWKV